MKPYWNKKTIHFVSRYESGQRSDSDLWSVYLCLFNSHTLKPSVKHAGEKSQIFGACSVSPCYIEYKLDWIDWTGYALSQLGAVAKVETSSKY